MKKILLVNFILILFAFITADIIYFFIQGKIENLPMKEYKFFNVPKEFNNTFNGYTEGEEYKGKKPPIIITGCSFGYSWGLKKEETLAYKLAKETKRTVIVEAIPAGGPNETLKIFDNEGIYKKYDEPDYIIYFFIENHFSRMKSRIYSLQSPELRPMYDIDNNYNYKEIKKNNDFLFLSHIYKYNYRKNHLVYFSDIDPELFCKTMIAIKKQISKHFKKTKFVVLRYDEACIENPYIFEDKYIKMMTDNGIIYLDADELVKEKTGERMIGEKYMQEDQHPSAYAFEILAPELAKELK